MPAVRANNQHMISKIAWDNIHWLKAAFFDKLQHIGGSSVAVDSFRPYLKRSWVKRLKTSGSRKMLFAEIENWAVGIKSTPLFTVVKTKSRGKGIHVARGGPEYSELISFLLRTHYNLYSLATHRKTIEELALGAYAYCSKSPVHTKKFDQKALADFRRLLRLSKTFLLAEWVQDMIERAIANRDVAFFKVLSNAVTEDIMVDTSVAAREWLVVILLWFLGGREYDTRRLFLYNLQRRRLLPHYITEESLNAELRRLGLTTTSL